MIDPEIKQPNRRVTHQRAWYHTTPHHTLQAAVQVERADTSVEWVLTRHDALVPAAALLLCHSSTARTAVGVGVSALSVWGEQSWRRMLELLCTRYALCMIREATATQP